MEEGDGMNARRTVIRLTFEGVDISADINRNLLSMTYTDNEEDKTKAGNPVLRKIYGRLLFNP